MTENVKARDSGVPTAFRLPTKRRVQLQLIQQEKGHSHLSVTLNEAVDRYIESYLRGELAA